MSIQPSVIERAFQLAKSGRYESVPDIRAQLVREAYETADAIRGTNLVARLSTMINAARMGAR